MRQLRQRLIFVIALFAAVLSAADAAVVQDPPKPWPGVRHVVIIGVDGLSGPGVEMAKTPVINELLTRGAHTFEARGVFPTNSSPNWTSMITGAKVEAHGVLDNDWRLDSAAIAPRDPGSGGMYSTIFDQLRNQRPDAKIAVIHHWGDFGRLFEQAVCDFAQHLRSAERTTEVAIEQIERLRPELTFIHLDHVDGAGHAAGWETPIYLEAVESADAMIGQVIEALKRAGMWDSTLLIVTSDHGGIGRGHGGRTMKELLIPWIIHGPGIAPGRQIEAPVTTMDTAGTAAAALGIRLAPSAVGRGVIEAKADFPPTPGRAVDRAFLPRPAVNPPGGRFVGSIPPVELSHDPSIEGLIVRYTLDGSAVEASSMTYSGPLMLQESTRLRAASFGPTGMSREVDLEFRLVTPIEGHGVSYALFPGEFSVLPDFSMLRPVREGVVPEFDVQDVQVPRDQFAVRFAARWTTDVAGEHRFWTASDDGSRLLVNGKRVVDNDGKHGVETRTGTITLEPGTHEIVVEYFNGGGGAFLNVFFQPPGGERKLLTTDRLTPVK